MAWADDYLCFVLYFDVASPKTWEQQVWGDLNSLAAHLQCEPTHFEFRTTEEGWVVDRQPWRYITRNVNRLTKQIEIGGMSIISLLHVGADVDFVMSPFAAIVDNPMLPSSFDNPIDETGELFVQLMVDRVPTSEAPAALCQRMVDMATGCFDAFYGVFHVLFGGKYPGLYFRQPPMSVHLTRAEKKNCEEWATIGPKRQGLIRGVYWGNLLTPVHWGGTTERRQQLANRLSAEGGAVVIDLGERLFFHAPFSPIRHPAPQRHKFDPPRDEAWQRQMAEFRQKCRRVLQEEGVPMLQSPEE